MKNVLKAVGITTIALTAIGVAVRAKVEKNKIKGASISNAKLKHVAF